MSERRLGAHLTVLTLIASVVVVALAPGAGAYTRVYVYCESAPDNCGANVTGRTDDCTGELSDLVHVCCALPNWIHIPLLAPHCKGDEEASVGVGLPGVSD